MSCNNILYKKQVFRKLNFFKRTKNSFGDERRVQTEMIHPL
jgi:hypothetical protein